VAKLLEELRRMASVRGLRNRPGVVAVSGGADSVALVRGLLDVDVPVIVGHFNHRLRGAESDADEAFVRELAATLGVRCEVGWADVAAVAAERKGNLESTARDLRYEWLASVTPQGGWVATGHTADDQAETVLHRLIRGTGLRGLRGIAEVRLIGSEIELIRPLLAVTRDDVVTYLASRNQPFREDSSNADLAFTRNRIRRELLPLLKTFNPAIVSVLGRLAHQTDRAASLLQGAASTGLRNAELPRAGDLLVFDRLKLTPLGDYLIAEVFRLVWDRERWPTNAMTAEHWERVTAIVCGELPAADFPDGVVVRAVGKVVQLQRRG
jgi:tRNA(Ile)-lysidine synthase